MRGVWANISRLNLTACAIGIALLVVIVYAQVIHHDFINYDDDRYVYDNATVQEGITWDGVVWAFTTGTLSNWHPLTWLSYMLDVELFSVNPGAMHAINAVLHLANSLLLLVLLVHTTGQVVPAGVVAALFAVHPLHVESVAWIAERKDVLSTFFGLAAIMAYCAYAAKPSVWRNAVVTVLLALGLVAKPMLVTWPFVFMLLDYWPLARPWSWKLILEKVPHFALVLASSIVTYAVQSTGGAVSSLEDTPVTIRLQNAAISYATYLMKTFRPINLGVLYPYPKDLYPALWVAGAVVALGSVTIIAFVLRRSRPYIVVGWLWYLGTLVPVIGLVKIGGQAYADRYTYVPLIGIFIAVVWLVADLAHVRRGLRISASAAGVAAILILTALSHAQTARWRDSFTLYEHTLAVAPSAGTIHFNLGNALLAEGRAAEAEKHFAAGAALSDNTEDLSNLGLAQLNQGRLDEAERTFMRALDQNPGQVEAHINLGVIAMQREHWEEAAVHITRALSLEPENAVANLNLGILHASTEQWQVAEAALQEARAADPEDYRANYHLGRTLLALGRRDEAAQWLEKAADLSTDRPAVYFQLGNAYLGLQRWSDAQHAFERTIALEPENAVAEINLGIVLASQQDLAGAETHLRRALEIAPENADAHFNLAIALHLTGQNDEAKAHIDEALRINPGDARAQQLQAQLGG